MTMTLLHPCEDGEGELVADVGQITDDCSGDADRWLGRWWVEVVLADDETMVTGVMTDPWLVVTMDTWWLV